MYFLWGHTRRCLTPRSSCYKHTEDAFHLGFAFQPGWPLLNKKRVWGLGEGLICDPRDWSLRGLHLIHMIILKYNVSRPNVLVIFFSSYFRDSLMNLVIDVFHQFWVESHNLYIRIKFFKLPFLPAFWIRAISTKSLSLLSLSLPPSLFFVRDAEKLIFWCVSSNSCFK